MNHREKVVGKAGGGGGRLARIVAYSPDSSFPLESQGAAHQRDVLSGIYSKGVGTILENVSSRPLALHINFLLSYHYVLMYGLVIS